MTELEPTEYDASDPYRPLYHYSPGSGDMADPNGLLADDGTFHLFHQTWGTWVHATSTDLMAWEDQGVALEHDDLGQAMSGSAVVDGQLDSSVLLPAGGLTFSDEASASETAAGATTTSSAATTATTGSSSGSGEAASSTGSATGEAAAAGTSNTSGRGSGPLAHTGTAAVAILGAAVVLVGAGVLARRSAH